MRQFTPGAVVGVQVVPESTEVNIPTPEAAAASFVPSTEEAMEIQLYMGEAVSVQLVPELVDV